MISTSTLKPIKLYSLNTPNVAKVFILLELLELPYESIKVNIANGDQFKDDFIKINPNSKIPAIVDPNVPEGKSPIVLFESGNILIYLAKTYANGKYLPNETTHTQEHYEVLGWVFFQMASLGPNLGQYTHYSKYAEVKYEYPIKRHYNEVRRLFHVLERQLIKHAYVAGDELTIADIAIYPWSKFINTLPDITEQDYPKLYEYHNRIAQLPAVQTYKKYDDELTAQRTAFTAEQRKILFGRDK
ncbi:hypothetical protein SAMD00019534_050200 [Acytostelium subglobosum LB1]|uniref:hypothetical protein n=1 Tax=Acytostelium subglobosum LB1 TaxID=1410327 RepID=UPI00064522A1|nr:hypothetical protein SAMD00019534_050200 [Acytostelium subglobosum LB1]GAM21845.1 hypothetical protein SAMD00019534_050200 [Acytostelium subglobosum LB1]|eukprot:XP_012754945.1 hypothetical protein SAMD00019534_050200 [Acytostelium subglobosum LB1]